MLCVKMHCDDVDVPFINGMFEITSKNDNKPDLWSSHLNLILDSHIGEVYNLASILYHFADEEEIDINTTLNIFSMKRSLSQHDIQREFSGLKELLIFTNLKLLERKKLSS